MRGRVEDRRVAVGRLERRREVLARQPVDLVQDLARRVRVDLREGPAAEHLVAPEDLEQVELDVTQVALVVAHRQTPSAGSAHDAQRRLLVSNLSILLASSFYKRTTKCVGDPAQGRVSRSADS